MATPVGTPPNLIGIGMLEKLAGVDVTFFQWMLLGVPAMVLMFGLIAVQFYFAGARHAQVDAASSEIVRDELERLGPVSHGQRNVLIAFGITVLLWVTDFAHHIKPGWIALAAGFICLIPGLGLARAEEAIDFNKLTSVFSLAAVLGVATVLTHSGAGAMIAHALTQLVPSSGASPTYGFMLIASAASLIATFATVVGCIAIVTPTLPAIEAATHLPLTAGIMAELTGLQAVFFPFETVPIMVGLMMGKVPAARTLRVMILLAATGLLIIAPLQIAWLKLLGLMP